MDKLIIYGAGKIARTIYEYIKEDYTVVCFAVDKEYGTEKSLNGIPIVHFDNIENYFEISTHLMLIAVGYLDMNEFREKKYKEGKAKGYKFINYIHPSVILHDCNSMGENNIVLENVSIQPDVQIGNNNVFWSNVVLSHGVVIGDSNWITSGVVISGDTELKSHCFLGVNSTVGHNLLIEENTFIGASTLITKSTNSNDVFISKSAKKYILKSKQFMRFANV